MLKCSNPSLKINIKNPRNNRAKEYCWMRFKPEYFSGSPGDSKHSANGITCSG